jgi:hypothetical protein
MWAREGIASMMPDLNQLFVWSAAYMASGVFFVLRPQDEARRPVCGAELGGLGFVALCWLPIALGNLVNLLQTNPPPAVLLRFQAEAGPPLVLLLTIVLVASGLGGI